MNCNLKSSGFDVKVTWIEMGPKSSNAIGLMTRLDGSPHQFKCLYYSRMLNTCHGHVSWIVYKYLIAFFLQKIFSKSHSFHCGHLSDKSFMSRNGRNILRIFNHTGGMVINPGAFFHMLLVWPGFCLIWDG